MLVRSTLSGFHLTAYAIQSSLVNSTHCEISFVVYDMPQSIHMNNWDADTPHFIKQ